jgi:hypothetical protein
MLSNITQIIEIGLQYIATNPAKAVLAFFTLSPVRNTLVCSLTDDQLEWLSKDIQTNPMRFLDHLKSPAGRQEIARIFENYQKSVTGKVGQPKMIMLSVAPAPAQIPIPTTQQRMAEGQKSAA